MRLAEAKQALRAYLEWAVILRQLGDRAGQRHYERSAEVLAEYVDRMERGYCKRALASCNARRSLCSQS